MGFHNNPLGSGGDLECHYGKESDSYKYMHEQFKIIVMGYSQKGVARSKEGGGGAGYILSRRYQYIEIFLKLGRKMRTSHFYRTARVKHGG